MFFCFFVLLMQIVLLDYWRKTVSSRRNSPCRDGFCYKMNFRT
ncbi:hypothetical protein BACUNI_02650 [Bacteroides uniformis ATCC 8492]|uniref:Uncharacterized protein n=1 Tax=Bacteroides uniformis (strain ATCC 8492 / DSM 6597 / CCUG 4942 / CIP 103695 / JCM 5828 / KCTC 5204 / NCTC 13054 / VPI 0061) TaxID=411479 RepID=A0ABC9NB67_BACUC|nr:hypothetical protein BACUNI_02650 [Bacteroides uniformis ATCC 8492]